ncbi:hypothetical protein L3Q72_00395 [Vibrio sp. JC009]|uniref:hypothetical protein n=1 Tax=Vibrio sp. JC009 TaxID=2912314 RepID=UPI0023B08114|nr:hypothetical protein [Vibrio sp. JC009]WED21910.1 hypothetical protein L3Q72_00395 [Vibrio sp. JC009]
MKKKVLTVLIGMSFSVSAASMENLSISGFGSVGVGKSDNDVGYAGYTSDHIDTKQDTLAGIQFDFEVNDKAEFTAQLVANGRYDFEPTVEVAYVSYDFDRFVARAGKMRTPLFMYSDYLDVGYALPAIRPSQEMYEHIIINSYTGGDLLIPFDIGDTHLQLQPFIGVSQVEARDTPIGKVDLNNTFGLTAHWYIDDLTLRASYVSTDCDYSYKSPAVVTSQEELVKKYAADILKGQEGQFISAGVQYDNGSVLTVLEGMTMKMTGRYPDVAAVSGLLGYRFGDFTPYFSVNWNKSTDDEERAMPVNSEPGNIALFAGEKVRHNFEKMAFSVGSRWDLVQNIALKLDVTYVDYMDTSGGYSGNIGPKPTFEVQESDSFVYSLALDFVF